MADFERAIEVVLAHEGGYTNNPLDPGGETKFGISKRSYPDLDIPSLTLDDAKAIYRRDFWRYDGIESQDIATKVLDMTVNDGPMIAHIALQKGLKFLGYPVVTDGKFGHDTLDAVNRVDPNALLMELRARAAEYYTKIVILHPDRALFLLSWLRRAVS